MRKAKSISKKSNGLKRRAEKLLSKKGKDIQKMSTEGVEKLIHELQVRQNELEMRNEELRKAEVGLKEGREYLRLAQRAANARAWSWNIVTGELKWAEEFYAAYGLGKRIKPYYEDWLRTIHPEDREKVDKTLGEAINNKGEIDVEYRTILPDGTIRWLNAKGQTFCDETNRPVRMVGITLDITERRRMEEVLQKSEARYRSYIELTQQLAWTTNADGEVMEDIPSWRIFTGQREEEVKGWGWSKALHPDDLEDTIRTWRNAVRTKNDYETEYRVRRYDGAYRHLLARGVPVFQDNGEIQEWVGTCIDITERKRAEETLRESEERFRTAVESMSDSFAIFSAVRDERGRVVDFRFEYINETGARMNYRPRADHVGKTILELLPAHKGTKLFVDYIRITEEGGSIAEESVVYEDVYGGKRLNRAFDVRATKLGDGFAVVWRDVTERKRMEEELRGSREDLEKRVQERTAEVYRQAELLNLGHEAIIARDMDCKIVFWNNGAEEVYGWTKPEALGKISYIFLRTQFPISYDYHMAELIRKGRWEGELVNTRKDGSQVTVISRQALQRDEKGQPTGILEINLDITERLKLEQQLRQAQKLEALGTLTGGIAHDFNNILATIVINSEMALFDLPRGSAVRSNLDLILKSGLRGKDLVRQMLLFSRKSGKKQEIITLTPLIKETFKLLRSSIPTTIQMKLYLETESDSVSADPSQIQQVIMNLCTNAAYAMRGTTGSIDISLRGITFGSTDLPEADMQPGDYLVLSVRDTGSGMDKEVSRRIFEPFFTTKPVGEGTGLGLSVVYGIVKNHKGNITVYSEPGRGSIFRVYLPKVDTGPSMAPETPKPIPRGSERILLLDDEEIIVNSVRNMLQHLGYKVTALMDNREALKLFSEKHSEFDLVITDQTMPFMTGEDLGKELMRIRPDIPIILCTGYSDLISSEKAMAMGFRGFIMKPFTVREAAELVRRVLDQKEPSNLRKNP